MWSWLALGKNIKALKVNEKPIVWQERLFEPQFLSQSDHLKYIKPFLTCYFSSGPKLKEGQSRILPRNEAQDDLVVVVGLGKKDQSIESQREGHDLAREAIRTSISSAVRSLKGMITA